MATKRLLIVDDEESIAFTLQELLEDEGYLVTCAADGNEGLELARSNRFDLIVTDVMMPKLDGPSFISKLRETDGYGDTPVVFITAVPHSLKNGPFSTAPVIKKPFRFEDLLELINQKLA